MGRVMEVHNLVDNKTLTPLWPNPCGLHNILSYGPQKVPKTVWLKSGQLPSYSLNDHIFSAKWNINACLEYVIGIESSIYFVSLWLNIDWGKFALHDGKFNTLRPRQNGCHFADDIFKCIFVNENISTKISLNYVPYGLIDNMAGLVQIMAWRRPGNKPLSEPMMVNLLTHICVTRPQWFNTDWC